MFLCSSSTGAACALTVAVSAWSAAANPVGAAEHKAASDAQVAAAIAAAKPGDVITLAAGQYAGGWTLRPGEAGKPITLHAERKGRVFVGAVKSIAGFEPAAGLAYASVAPLAAAPKTLVEIDTGSLLRHMARADDVDEVVGSWCYDVKAARVYVHTTDRAPASRHLIASMADTTGIQMANDTTLDGLVVSGFNGGAIRATEMHGLVVRNCVVYYNAGGVSFGHCSDVLAEYNEIWGNRDRYAEAAQLWATGGGNNIRFEHNLIKGGPSDRLASRMYSELFENCAFRYNTLVGESATFFYKDSHTLKAAADGGPTLVTEFNVALNGLGGTLQRFNTYTTHDWGGHDHPDKTTELVGLKPAQSFADPTYYDYRLQDDSPARGAAAGGKDLGAFQYDGSVLYVSATGDDKNPGTSRKHGWRTLAAAARQLKAGQTLYIEQGLAGEELTLANLEATADRPTIIRAYGGKDVTLPEITIKGCKNLRVERLRSGGVSIDSSRQITLDRCITTGRGVRATGSEGVALEYAVIVPDHAPALALERCKDVEVTSGILAGTADDAIAGRDTPGLFLAFNTIEKSPPFVDAAKGDYRIPAESTLALAGRYLTPAGAAGLAESAAPAHQPVELVEVVGVSATTADLFWRTPGRMCGTAIRWGLHRADENTYNRAGDNNSEFESVHTVSLVGLKPSTTYQFQIAVDGEHGVPLWQPKGYRFTTAAQDEEPRRLYISNQGSDSNNGLTAATPWRSVRKACRETRPGDVVTFAPGTYSELLRPLRSGSQGKPITFRAEKPLTVWFDGTFRKHELDGRPFAAQLNSKAFIHLENLCFEKADTNDYGDHRGGWGYAGLVRLSGSGGVEITNCVIDGRHRWMVGLVTFGAGEMPGLGPKVQGALIRDTLFLGCWRSFAGYAAREVRFDHCVMYRSLTAMINPYAGGNLVVRNTIYHDLVRQKNGNPWISIRGMDAKASIDSNYNCFVFNPDNSNHFVGYEDKTPCTLDRWKKLGEDVNSIEADPGYPGTKRLDFDAKLPNPAAADVPLRLDDFLLPSGSPCLTAGDDGGPIGIRWAAPVPAKP